MRKTLQKGKMLDGVPDPLASRGRHFPSHGGPVSDFLVAGVPFPTFYEGVSA